MSNSQNYFGQFEIEQNHSGEEYFRVLDAIYAAEAMSNGSYEIFIDATQLMYVNAEDRWYSQYDELIGAYENDAISVDCTRNRYKTSYVQNVGEVLEYLEGIAERANEAIHDIEIANPPHRSSEERIREAIDAEYPEQFGVEPPRYVVTITGRVESTTVEKLWKTWLEMHIHWEHYGEEEECEWA